MSFHPVDGRAVEAGATQRDLVTLLWTDPRARSRNKNFERFRDDRRYRRAVRRVRTLLALRRDILRFRRSGILSLRWNADRSFATLTIEVPHLSLLRTCFLMPFEVELLEESSGVLASLSSSPDRRE